MRRLWVRWALLVVFVALLAVVFVLLGDWQLDRLSQRQQRNVVTAANEQAAVAPAAEVFVRPIEESDQWRKVHATGTFDAAHQFVVRYRQNGDQGGYEVVTPLRTGFGTLLVDRGLVPLARGAAIPASAPAPPAGQVRVVGYVRRDEQGGSGAVVPQNGQVRLINSEALAAALPYPVVHGYLSALTLDPAQAGRFQAITPPELNEGPHFWYAVQWFMFAAIGILGIVVFIRGDLRERRLARAASAAPPAPAGPADRVDRAEEISRRRVGSR